MKPEDILKQVFGQPDSQIQTFMDVIKPNVTDPNDSEVSRIVRGTPDQIAAPELAEQRSGFIRIQHGWHDQDYVWHVSPWHERKPWKVALERVVYACAQVMNSVIPKSTDVRIWYPHNDWQIPEITFKAIALRAQWNVRDEHLQKMTDKLFEILNTLV